MLKKKILIEVDDVKATMASGTFILDGDDVVIIDSDDRNIGTHNLNELIKGLLWLKKMGKGEEE